MLFHSLPEILFPQQHFSEQKIFEVKNKGVLLGIILLQINGDQTAFRYFVSDGFHNAKLPKMQQPPLWGG